MSDEGWRRIDCEERDQLFQHGSRRWSVNSSLTDLEGAFGTPEIFTEWADENGQPTLRDRRWPRRSGHRPDARPCEHYVPVVSS